MIFVSGANGQFARAVITTILANGRAASLAVGTRDVNSAFATELAGRGVSVRHADFRDPELMRQALKDVDKALFIPTYDTNDQRLQQNLNALEAARAVGVGHIVYPSFLNAESTRVEHSRLVHLPTEKAIRASGLGFTILRHALYADILVGDIKETLESGVLHRPGRAARCAYVARADLGVSAAQVLMSGEPSGRTYSETMERTLLGQRDRVVDDHGVRQARALPGGRAQRLAALHDREMGRTRRAREKARWVRCRRWRPVSSTW